ncbi:hypothetical protein BT69DRAFT_1356195 [Atractiella rhizophila]|nr:hypothetical protein BT69DRAFT_1356195 [Atractiella rhizophila]
MSSVLGRKRALSPDCDIPSFKRAKFNAPFTFSIESVQLPTANFEVQQDVVMEVEPAHSPMEEAEMPNYGGYNANEGGVYSHSTLRLYPAFGHANANKGEAQTVRHGAINVCDPQGQICHDGHDRALMVPNVTTVPASVSLEKTTSTDIGGHWIYDNCNGGMIFIPASRHSTPHHQQDDNMSDASSSY